MHYLSSSKLSDLVSKIKESSFNGRWQQVLSLCNELNKSGGLQLTQPSLFHPILKACAAISLNHGKSLHASVIKLGVESCTSIGNSIMDLYAKAGQMGSTFSVFGCMTIKDSVSWNILISGHLHHGDMDRGICLFMQARATGFAPNISTLVLVIQTIRNLGALREGQKMHGYMIKTRFLATSSVQNSLLSMYADMAMEFARKLFDEMSNRDMITWSIMISGYVKDNESCVALGVFREMLSHLRTEVDGQTTVSALKACTNLNNLITGRMLHGFIFHRGFGFDLFIGNSLIDMYSKCNDPDSALQAWREIPLKNIVSWNSLLSGFVSNHKHSEALHLFDSMQKVGVEPDTVTLVNLLQVCKHFADPLLCKGIHTVIIRQNYELNELVINTLIDVYAKCNLINWAQKLFSWIKIRDTITWSTMIAAFTYCGLPDESIGIYQKMIDAREKPNAITILNLIEACSFDAELKRPKSAHGIAIRRGFASDAIVGTAILDTYAKYGDIITAKKAFHQISNKNVISYSAMIAAYGMNGLARDALSLLDEMETRGLKPNSVTILSVLSACSHGGLIDKGLSFFQKLIETQDFKPNLEHYSCLIDLLSRCGKLDLGTELIKKLAKQHKAGASAWGALLSGCRISYNGNKEINEKVVSRVLELEPNNSSGYMLASSVFAARGLWEDAARIRALVREKHVKIVAGNSMVHVNNKCYRFVAGDRNQFLSNEIRTTIEELHKCMKMKKSWMESYLV
ncbi:pentatricopeptide repeat-containing protein At2g17210 [Cynara cardunculus var. scolymus]|uniref:pentatricopeptide repeat-containing protein At2g17210 n=1 Tax=Cynara cardunculus var. scolymus TaxID=59895 RepID=UPI000D6240C0|nr:pentatricopeptide repeat-containing protein At2g17210 [Cynara cardunculus var. scolymus]